jgi:hypothetical protein
MLSYFDPGAGVILMTALAGGVAGFAVFFKIYYHRFLGVFSKKHRAKYEQATTELVGEDVTHPKSDTEASV